MKKQPLGTHLYKMNDAVYMGTQNWHPQLSSFLLGERNKQFFFRPDSIIRGLSQSLTFLAHLQKNNQKIWFISTRAELKPIIDRTAKKLNQRAFVGKWIGGQLTNREAKDRPDCLFLFDPTKEILREAAKVRIPVISLLNNRVNTIDTKGSTIYDKIMKDTVHYLIPAPNINIVFVYSLCSEIIQSFKIGQKK